jgi:collagen type VII alpha
MPRDVIITPASGLVDFKDDAGNIDAKVQIDTTGNLSITNSGGNLSIGDSSATVYIGDGVSGTDIVFEQNGAIRALSGKTLTLGQTNSTIRINAIALNLDGNTVLQVDGVPVINTAGFWVGPQGGISGFSGYSGATGSNGSAGATGASGFSGYSGATGSNGSAGATGASGFSGYSGATGSNGSAGATGASGFSGFSGAAGPSTTINATNFTTAGVHYPVFVAAAGSNQTARVRTTANALSYNPGTGELAATDFNSLSDVTLKNNIQPIKNTFDVLSKINPVSFNWNDMDKKSFGFIAQEMEKVLPEIVTETQGIKAISYTQIIPFLVDAIKKLQKQIDDLKNK